MIFKQKTIVLSLSIMAFCSSFVNAETIKEAGKTLLAKGKVEALSLETSQARGLKRRSPIYKIDQVSTFEQSQAQLKMVDGALLALKANTAINIEEYFLNSDGNSGSVVMELVSGGLRTITGSIKGNSNNYKLKTPVGSIGIRGTHYEVEIVNGELFMAVWDGSIEISSASLSEPLILGSEGSHAFAKISQKGDIQPLLKPPTELTSLSAQSERKADNLNEKVAALSNSIQSNTANIEAQATENEKVTIVRSVKQEIEDTSFLNEEVLDNFVTEDTDKLIAQRTGVVEYSDTENFALTSSSGEVNNFKMSINVDFDNALVPKGQLSFNDDGGEWFAVFNGLINAQGMQLGINYASHGQNLASGDIQAQFSDELSKIRGNFELYEVENITTRAGGLYVVKEK